MAAGRPSEGPAVTAAADRDMCHAAFVIRGTLPGPEAHLAWLTITITATAGEVTAEVADDGVGPS